MEELHIRRVATHGDPESCVDVPRGRGEALTGARVGGAMEPRNHRVRGAHTVQDVEGHIVGGASVSRRRTPRGALHITVKYANNRIEVRHEVARYEWIRGKGDRQMLMSVT